MARRTLHNYALFRIERPELATPLTTEEIRHMLAYRAQGILPGRDRSVPVFYCCLGRCSWGGPQATARSRRLD